MKKYKLIKTYPGSPQLGYISTEGVDDGIIDPQKFPEFWEEIFEIPEYVKCIKIVGYCIIGKIYKTRPRLLTNFEWKYEESTCTQPDIISNINDGWDYGGNINHIMQYFTVSTKEEYDAQFVDYKILSFYGQNNIFTLRDNGEYITNTISNWNGDGKMYRKGFYLGKNDFEIHSVKRLSDGEIFTVGDKVQWNWYTADVSYFTIAKIYLYNDIFFFDTVEKSAQKFHFYKSLKKYKKSLFTTEDNVPIYEGDEYWIVNKYNWALWEGHTDMLYTYAENHIKFSTKQAAEEYVAKNTVLFVTEDGKEIKHGDCFYVIKSDFTDDAVYSHIAGLSINKEQAYKNGWLYFSTKEKAEEYIDLNKPKYSINQIKEAFKELNLDLSVAIRLCVHIINKNSK